MEMDRTSIAKKLKEGRNMDEISLPDFEAFYEVRLIMSFRTGRGTRDQIANIRWIIEKAREFQKNISFVDNTKAFGCVYHNKLCKILKS